MRGFAVVIEVRKVVHRVEAGVGVCGGGEDAGAGHVLQLWVSRVERRVGRVEEDGERRTAEGHYIPSCELRGWSAVMAGEERLLWVLRERTKL